MMFAANPVNFDLFIVNIHTNSHKTITIATLMKLN